MYNLEEFLAMAIAIWAIIERIKPIILKPAKAKLANTRFPLTDDRYAVLMQLVAFGVGLCFTIPAKADFLLAIGYDSLDPMVGAVVGALVMSFGVQGVEWAANLRKGVEFFDWQIGGKADA